MSRDGSGVYSLPAGLPSNGDTSDATDDIRTPLLDLETDMNTARPIVAGGTGATSASGARTNLGLVIGTNVQAYDADLAAIAALTSAANKVPYATGAATWALADFTSYGRSVVAVADEAALKALVNLEIGTDVQAYDADLGALAGLASNGMIARTGSGTAAVRTITAGAGISITNGDGVSGNPTISATGFTYDSAAATTSGATVTLTTSIPATATEIIIHFIGVSLSGADDILVQLGDSGGIETSGYDASSFVNGGDVRSTSGFPIYVSNAARAVRGVMRFYLTGTNVWASQHGLQIGTTLAAAGGGDKTLSDTLTQIRLANTGASTFDAGSAKVGWR